MNDADVERAGGELVEGNDEIFGFGVTFVNFSEDFNGAADFGGRGVVSEADVHDGADARAARDVDDRRVAHRFVGNGNEMAVAIANARAAQADGFHGAFDRLEFYGVADREGLIDEDRDRAK